ncbi:NADPH-dependent oxidoreductase [Staphylococcus massiliensis]|uniref:NADPH-dependent oxidoreductase n=1 Tax=Staphylococcus massiliensis S46 TaxID=1229783 RepID=K9ALF2_9STAP|nr:NADPH-dependent oxidoreductase [Staphylococcus massiliensis]EKU48203.1 hypothetical protein C273_05837 [Staphylococcus massiliensis S46]MCG3399535.1 NADPH-dependent oxidoreductase [Staphylococcus massiliensis]MCG3402044.1 NADPH-dependent oxidoreductase [Staphylococcus massiliensis]MCG3412705.1 NADPH-dependent oxidoreductase [Staphylococcus massiliensis]POA00748.1 NADPH-dependent oxidoreductase [Staphylococcus massiliensis CCUG 55927]
MSNHVYDLAKRHHSVRKFKNHPLDDATIKKLVEAGQSASTSSYLQTYSIIGVRDPKIKESLKEVSGQPYVEENGYLFVFVLDYYRHALIDEKKDSNMSSAYESAEGLLVGAIDVALVSENMALCAEDMGYGIVYLGSLRNDVDRVRDILGLPEYAFPLFGMAIGEISEDENGTPKPRLPFEHVFHEDQYNADKEKQLREIEAYDEAVKDYYEKRTNGKRSETWSDQISGFMSSKQRPDMMKWLHETGLLKR